MNDELVSYYMSVKNGMPFLQQAITSVKNQERAAWELVVVDDGSTDSTLDYLSLISSQDDRIKYIETGGVGRSRALNIAIENTNGKYISNLDADDVIHPEKTWRQLEEIKENGASFISSNRIIVDDNWVCSGSWHVSSVSKIETVNSRLARGNPICHSTVMAEKNMVIAVGGYNEERAKQVDYELWFRMAKSGVALYKSDTCLTAKRVHKGQSYQASRRLSYAYSSFLLQRKIIDHFNGGILEKIFLYRRILAALLPRK